jgi:hypothetical protein
VSFSVDKVCFDNNQKEHNFLDVMSFVVDCQNVVKTDILIILIASEALSEDSLNIISRIFSLSFSISLQKWNINQIL